jgi:hypothetical protein
MLSSNGSSRIYQRFLRERVLLHRFTLTNAQCPLSNSAMPRHDSVCREPWSWRGNRCGVLYHHAVCSTVCQINPAQRLRRLTGLASLAATLEIFLRTILRNPLAGSPPARRRHDARACVPLLPPAISAPKPKVPRSSSSCCCCCDSDSDSDKRQRRRPSFVTYRAAQPAKSSPGGRAGGDGTCGYAAAGSEYGFAAHLWPRFMGGRRRDRYTYARRMAGNSVGNHGCLETRSCRSPAHNGVSSHHAAAQKRMADDVRGPTAVVVFVFLLSKEALRWGGVLGNPTALIRPSCPPAHTRLGLACRATVPVLTASAGIESHPSRPACSQLACAGAALLRGLFPVATPFLARLTCLLTWWADLASRRGGAKQEEEEEAGERTWPSCGWSSIGGAQKTANRSLDVC